MAVIVAGNYYRFKSVSELESGNNRYLNILTDKTYLQNQMNVTTCNLYEDDMGQVWHASVYIHASTIQYLLKSVKDTKFVLDRWRGSTNYNNADINEIGINTTDLNDQVIVFVPSGSYYKIKLANQDLYLTVTNTSTYQGHNVNWQSNTGSSNQLWLAELYNSGSSGDNTPSTPSNTVSINLRNKISSYNQRADSKYEFACAGVCGCMAINTHPDAVPENYIIPEANWNAIASLVGKTADPQNDTSLVNILNLLQQEYPVMVRTRTEDTSQYGQHWVIIYGYSGSATNVTASGFMCIDPYGANTTDTFGKDCSLVDSSHFVAVTRRVHFM